MNATFIRPKDNLLHELNLHGKLEKLIELYPWDNTQDQDTVLRAVKEQTLDQQHHAALRSATFQIRRQSIRKSMNAQQRNNYVDALLRALDLYPNCEEYLKDDNIHFNRESVRHGLTVQHWLAALRDWSRLDVQDYSDGYAVNYWHVPNRPNQDFIIQVWHKHWWERERTEYIRLTAHEYREYRKSDRTPSKPSGSALLSWPWI